MQIHKYLHFLFTSKNEELEKNLTNIKNNLKVLSFIYFIINFKND